MTHHINCIAWLFHVLWGDHALKLAVEKDSQDGSHTRMEENFLSIPDILQRQQFVPGGKCPLSPLGTYLRK